MVLCGTEHTLQADVIFVVEGTAVNGAYINDLKTNYIIPSLEYFSQGNLDETNYLTESVNSLYGIVIYQAADCLPHPSTDTIGPFTSSGKVLNAFEKLELIGGKGESHANIAEGLATALQCFEELQQKRDAAANSQKHCILVCNSPSYLLPVMESHTYSGKTSEQLAVVLQERGINLSVISPRKIPTLYKLFEKAGGDLSTSQTKNYAKDPRHLVLLKGFSLKERPISPPPGTVTSNQNTSLPMPSLPSPVANIDSPISSLNPQPNQGLLGSNVSAGVGVQPGQNAVYRPSNPQGITQLATHTQPMVSQGMVNVGMVNAARGGMMGNNQFANQPMQAPPGYHTATAPGRQQNRWSMLPPQAQQRPPFINQGQQANTTQGSALIAQLTQPPSSMSAGVNQFGQIQSNASINAQQQQLRINMLGNQSGQQNVQTSVPQNVQTSGIGQTAGIVSSGISPTSTISQAPNAAQVAASNQVPTSQAQRPPGQANQSLGASRERHTIWQGLLEWIEKPKISSDPKITRHVPCQVSAGLKDGKPEVKADSWPPKLIMQLMPKQLIGNIGGAYLKNSKSVLFHPQNCEALDALTKVMSSGFAGCVHFTSVPLANACDIKVLILLYTIEKRAYLGFIPNDQTAFVDRLRKVIQEQKSTQMLKQGQGGTPNPNMNPQSVGQPQMSGTPPQQLPVSNPSSQTTAQQQQGLMMSQTNTMAMGGGQITQNIVTSSSPSGAGIGGVLGQNIPGGMQPRIRMQGIQQASSPQVNQPGANTSNMSSGLMGAPLQRPPFDNNLEAARQQNLEKINQLKQTLEAAQQQEQQYKSQLERISHMKTSQLQEALQLAQQQEMQYKILDQQRIAANQGGPQGPNAAQQQQRMMRPMMNTNNPGLRHLLQQQPQYRQQLMGIPGGIGNGPRPQMVQQMQGNPGNNPQQPFDDVGNFDFM